MKPDNHLTVVCLLNRRPQQQRLQTLKDAGKQLKRGTLEMILLRLLTERPKYGYELVSEMEERSAGRFQIREGTLYPVLYRLEDQGCVEPEWDAPNPGASKVETPRRGVPRKYYRLTEVGSARLAQLRSEWRSFSTSVDDLLAAESLSAEPLSAEPLSDELEETES